MTITLKNVFDSEGNLSSELPITIEYSIDFAFVGYLILEDDILVLHVVAISDPHFGDRDNFYLADR